MDELKQHACFLEKHPLSSFVLTDDQKLGN